MLNRLIHYYPSSVGRVPTQIDYSDYRPVAGVMLPFKWTYGWVSGREEYEITEYTPNGRWTSPNSTNQFSARMTGATKFRRDLHTMHTSTDRILTTHVGSLPRPQDVVDALFAQDHGEAYDPQKFDATIRHAVADAVNKQAAAGIDIASDGGGR